LNRPSVELRGIDDAREQEAIPFEIGRERLEQLRAARR